MSSVDIEFRCAVCGSKLDASLATKLQHGSAVVEVEPCKECMARAKEEAREEDGGKS